MPTPGGLPKIGDNIVGSDGVIYKVIERTSTSAPLSLWIQRLDFKRITGFRAENLRNRGTQARLMCETGALPRGWHYATSGELLAHDAPGNLGVLRPGGVNDVATPAESAAMAADEILGPPQKPARYEQNKLGPRKYRNKRRFLIRDAHKYIDKKDAEFYGVQVDVALVNDMNWTQSFEISEEELFDMCIAGLQYLRDKPAWPEGIET